MRRCRAGALAGLLIAGLVLAPAAAAASTARASFTQIEDDVMCVVCHEPLNVASSPEAFQERDYIRGLIVQGKSRREIENDLVQQYGPAVLARPPAHGFNLLVYIIPPAALILGVVTVMITLPRWRRRTREAAALSAEPLPTGSAGSAGSAGPAFSAADARRLDEDLQRDF